MQIIKTEVALDDVADDTLRPILAHYAGMMNLATIYIAQPGDTLEALAKARGWPCECWEFITDHGGWLEGVFIVCDDGEGHVVLVPDSTATASDLLALFKGHASKAGG